MAATTLDTYNSKKGASGSTKFYTTTITFKIGAGRDRYDSPSDATQLGTILEDAISDYFGISAEFVVEVTETTEATWKKVNA